MYAVPLLGRFLGIIVISILIANQNPLISFGKDGQMQMHKCITGMGEDSLASNGTLWGRRQ